ncbi:DNA-3-methyladenine glycosylase [Acetobacteraceae bacterium]|nr:DNA-3-methyladenine glycosylase [Candidatus Parcubacteria bacterium]
MKNILGEDFFDRPTLLVARDLLGKFLVRKISGKEIALMITETEAYDGFKDLASHARRGKTPRNLPMYGKAGRIYVYFTYGMHWMLNLTCGKEEYPAAVLIRGAGLKPGDTRFARSISLKEIDLGEIVGPARLTKALVIDKSLNTKILSKKSGLWVEDRGIHISSKEIERTGRIGVDYSGEWAKKPWRFVLKRDKKTVVY